MQANYSAKATQSPASIACRPNQRWQLRPGLSLMIQNHQHQESAIVKTGSSTPIQPLGMSFCLSGHVQGRSSNSEKAFHLQAGQVSLGLLKGESRTIEYAAEPLLLVHLHIQPEAIGLNDPEAIEQLPDTLENAIANRHQTDYFHSHSMTTVMNATVQQLLSCPYQGLSKRLYLESKAVELISLYFDQLSSNYGTRRNKPQRSLASSAGDLKQDDVDRIVYARDILLSQVTNPPSLLAVAHQSGLNDRKLKQGFRQVFGTTVFGYLHQYRMQQAQQLLQMPQMTIASVAQRIGYRNPESFSVAFRRTFDISPKAYQMRLR